MSCGCKRDNTVENSNNSNNGSNIPKLTLTNNIFNYTLKILAFLMSIILLPLINIIIVRLMFNTLVLNKNVDIKPLLLQVVDKLTNKKIDDEDDDEDDDEELTEDDLILLDVEDITKVNNKE